MYPFKKLLWTAFIGLAVVSCKKSGGGAGTLAITSISPATGGKNTVITIIGNNFSTTPGDNQVTVNGHPAVVAAATPTALSVVVPPQAGTGKVEVRKGNEDVKGPVFTYQFNYYTVTTLAGSSRGFKNGKGSDAQFDIISQMAFDKDGNILVADGANAMIRLVTTDGTVSTLAGLAGIGDADGPAGSAQFRYVAGIVADKANNIYVSDLTNQKIRKLQYGPSGYVVTTLAGANAYTPGFQDGIGTNALFNNPFGLALDTVGNLFVADRGNHSVRRIALANTNVTTLAGSLQAGNQDGHGTVATFSSPQSLYVSPNSEYLIIGDVSNYNCRKATPLNDAASTNITTEIGSSPGVKGYQDGAYTAARFSDLTGVAVDEANGRWFIADQQNNCIRMVDTKAHTVSTFAGSPTKPGADDGPLASATFKLPSSIALDKEGNLYIGDGNFRIRKIAYE